MDTETKTMRVVWGQTSGYYQGELVAVGGVSGWWRALISDLFFNSDLPHYNAVHGVGENPSELRQEMALRKDAEEWADMAKEMMQAAGVDVDWLVQDFSERL